MTVLDIGRDTARTGTRRRSRRRRDYAAYLYLLPAFAVFGLFLLYPVVQSAWFSLYHYNGLTAGTWAGLSNYREILTQPLLRQGFLHTLVLILFYAVLPIALALVLTAVMSHARRMRGLTFFRTILFLPQVIASTVVATSWLAIYAPDGFLNAVLSRVGLHALTRPWLGDFSTALPAVGLIGTWAEIGFCLVLLLAGVAQIDQALYESAKMDGAGPVREFFAVTLPGLRGQIAVALTLTTIAALKTFDIVYVTTDGGPGNATATPAFQIYDRAFNQNDVGTACAIGIALTLVILVITLAVQRLQPGDEQ